MPRYLLTLFNFGEFLKSSLRVWNLSPFKVAANRNQIEAVGNCVLVIAKIIRLNCTSLFSQKDKSIEMIYDACKRISVQFYVFVDC